ncbi:MAG: hypothetical protein HY791_38215 [Deltaproteobacteria bacterium]|nr:hypothetical protein [Deltaproteobacteria bacterium]
MHALAVLFLVGATRPDCPNGGHPALEQPPPIERDVATLLDEWGELPPPPFEIGAGAAGVWTGSEALIWGGLTGGDYTNAGARFDPLAGTWEVMSTDGAPSPRAQATLTWCGAVAIAFGGVGPSGLLSDGGIYDPETDRWSALPVGASSPSARKGHTAKCAQGKLVVWGGELPWGRFSRDGARFDPATGAWVRLSNTRAPSARADLIAAWTGEELVLFGGRGRSGALGDGAAYDLGRDRWTRISGIGAPSPRFDASEIWTGGQLVAFGGRDESGVLGTTFGYDPIHDRWVELADSGAPTARARARAVWTGASMIIVGGLTPGGPAEPVGGRLDGLGHWLPLSSLGAPLSSVDQVVLWTGTELLMFGGHGGASYR